MKDVLKRTEYIVVLGLIAMGIISLYTGSEQLTTAIASGLVGYLGKDHIDRNN